MKYVPTPRPKGDQREVNGAKGEAKGDFRKPKRRRKGGQREPKGSPKGDLGCLGEPLGPHAVSDPKKGSVGQILLGAYLEPKPLKIDSKK